MIIKRDSEEFKRRLDALRPECSVALDALKDTPFEDWPKHLRQDAEKRMGLKMIIAFEVVEAVTAAKGENENG